MYTIQLKNGNISVSNLYEKYNVNFEQVINDENIPILHMDIKTIKLILEICEKYENCETINCKSIFGRTIDDLAHSENLFELMNGLDFLGNDVILNIFIQEILEFIRRKDLTLPTEENIKVLRRFFKCPQKADVETFTL